MTLTTLLDNLMHDTLEVSLPAWGPELALCATIVLMLLVRIPDFGRRINAAYIALAGSLAALWLTAPWKFLDPSLGAAPAPQELFTGLLVFDGLTVFFRAVLLLFAVLFVVLTRISGIPDKEDGPDFYVLVLGATLGMCIMASANHLLMVFLGVEMASVPSYALAGMLKGRRQSSEAALKYAVYGAGAAGIMLYGLSLVGGVLGSLHMPTMAGQLADMLEAGLDGDRQTVLVLGGLMLSVGLAFKLSAVPFHFWCPDVFEGASAEVNAFLSVASKAAALALLVRVAVGFGAVPQRTPVAENAAVAAPEARVAAAAARHGAPPVRLVSAVMQSTPASDPGRIAALAPARRYIVGLITLFAAVTCTFGNLAAYGQTNIKRLLAYSTIAHAGYLMMPVAAAVALIDVNPTRSEQAVASVAFYVAAYLFMNLGAFAVVAFLRNTMRSEEIADYAGLIKTCPALVVAMTVILLSLIGIPPLAGFAAKFNAFAALADAKLWFLLAIGGLNTVLSLFYYLRVIKAMTLDPEPASRAPFSFSMLSVEGVYVAAITLPVVLLGVWWDGLNTWARQAVSLLFS